MKKINLHTEIWLIGFILLASIIFAGIVGIHSYGDGSGYYLMANSLIKDGDLILDNEDIIRWNQSKFENVPFGAYVLIDKKGIMKYGKPVLYPLVAIPFFLLFGNIGFSLLNGLFLGGAIAFCYLFLRKYFKRNDSLFIATAFFLCSYMPVYAAWIHPDMMLFFACSLCMWLWCCKNKTGVAGLLIGVISGIKIFFLLLLLPFIITLLLKKNFRQLIKIIAMCFIGTGIMLLLTFLFLGQFWPYAGIGGYGYIPARLSPYLTLEGIKDALVIVPTLFEGIEFSSWGLFFRNILNFFIGRFSGIIWYIFPGIVCAGIYLLYRRYIKREEKITGDSILITVLLLVLTLIIARPLNYFGGRDFIGNRYFFILPALLFLPAIKMIKNPKRIALLFLPGILISSQIMKNEIFIKNWGPHYWKDPYIHGIHTTTFPLKYAPLEITQVESFLIPKMEISDNVFLYAPSGARRQVDKKVLIDKGREIVIVQENGIGDIIRLKTNYSEIILQPKIILRNKVNGLPKSFYYFKANQPTWIHNIEDVISERITEVYYKRGNAYYNKNQYNQAISDYSKALEIKPRYAQVYYNRGNAYAAEGKYTQAVSDYKRALKINPQDDETYNNRGVVYYIRGKYKRAISDYNKAIELNPRYAQVYNNRGNAYAAKGEYTRAISDYTKALEIEPKYAQSYYNRGNAYAAKAKYDKAISDYTKALEIDPRYAGAYFNKAVVWEETKCIKEATEAYRNFLCYAPLWCDYYIEYAEQRIEEFKEK